MAWARLYRRHGDGVSLVRCVTSTARGRSLGSIGAASPRSGAGRAPRAAGTKCLESGARATHFVLRPFGAGDGSDRVLACVWGPWRHLRAGWGSLSHDQELNEKFSAPVSYRSGLHAPVALAVPAIDSLALAQLLRRRDEVQAAHKRSAASQGVAIGVVHFCGPRLRPSRPEQDGRASSSLLTAVWHPKWPRRADRK